MPPRGEDAAMFKEVSLADTGLLQAEGRLCVKRHEEGELQCGKDLLTPLE